MGAEAWVSWAPRRRRRSGVVTTLAARAVPCKQDRGEAISHPVHLVRWMGGRGHRRCTDQGPAKTSRHDTASVGRASARGPGNDKPMGEGRGGSTPGAASRAAESAAPRREPPCDAQKRGIRPTGLSSVNSPRRQASHDRSLRLRKTAIPSVSVIRILPAIFGNPVCSKAIAFSSGLSGITMAGVTRPCMSQSSRTGPWSVS